MTSDRLDGGGDAYAGEYPYAVTAMGAGPRYPIGG